jgi:uncharacterized protein
MSSPQVTTDRVNAPALCRPVRWLYMALAAFSLVLAVVGALLPVMPTVPFVLVAAWAAAKSSPRLARWLETHPAMGPPIREWRQGGVVRRPVKWWTTLTMSGGGAFAAALARPWWVPAGVIAVMVAVGVWLWLRPEAPSAGQ